MKKGVIKFCLVWGSALLVSFSLFSQSLDTLGWKNYDLAIEHYSAKFPMAPYVKVDSVPKYKWLRRSDAKTDFTQLLPVQKSFIITAFTYPDTVLEAVKAAHQQDAYADSLVIHALAGKDPKIDKWHAVKTDGVMGKAYEITLDKVKFVARARVFYYKNEIILVLASGAKSLAGDGQIDFFLNSFHLLP